ncbi:hypothetical protein JG634_19625, partial [Vibrio cholerae]|uniref:hypothetical protein n=1 Tax=Vibrio cholerae TaxID=666 RepID=UPI0018F0B3C6
NISVALPFPSAATPAPTTAFNKYTNAFLPVWGQNPEDPYFPPTPSFTPVAQPSPLPAGVRMPAQIAGRKFWFSYDGGSTYT